MLMPTCLCLLVLIPYAFKCVNKGYGIQDVTPERLGCMNLMSIRGRCLREQSNPHHTIAGGKLVAKGATL